MLPSVNPRPCEKGVNFDVRCLSSAYKNRVSEGSLKCFRAIALAFRGRLHNCESDIAAPNAIAEIASAEPAKSER